MARTHPEVSRAESRQLLFRDGLQNHPHSRTKTIKKTSREDKVFIKKQRSFLPALSENQHRPTVRQTTKISTSQVDTSSKAWMIPAFAEKRRQGREF
jgi:hypothetical protein